MTRWLGLPRQGSVISRSASRKGPSMSTSRCSKYSCHLLSLLAFCWINSKVRPEYAQTLKSGLMAFNFLISSIAAAACQVGLPPHRVSLPQLSGYLCIFSIRASVVIW